MSLPLIDGSVVRVAPAPATPFAALVAAMDREVMEELGGESIIYQPAVGTPVSVTGMFDNQYQLAQGDAQAGVETLGPAVFLRMEDLPVDPELDHPTLIIRGVSYRVSERRGPDGAGGIILLLETEG